MWQRCSHSQPSCSGHSTTQMDLRSPSDSHAPGRLDLSYLLLLSSRTGKASVESVYDQYIAQSETTRCKGLTHIEACNIVIRRWGNIVARVILLHRDIARPRNPGDENVQRSLSDMLSRTDPTTKPESTEVLQVWILSQWLFERWPSRLEPSLGPE